LDHAQKSIEQERLADEARDVQFGSVASNFRRRREDDHRQFRQIRFGQLLRAKLPAVHDRHHQV